MASPKDKPRGYFEKLLAIDCETTGLNFNGDDPSEGHQAISWGIIVANANTLKPIEELYVEIKWNDEMKAKRKKDPTVGSKAEKIHGLSFEYLEKNGVTEERAIELIGSLILKHWGPTVSIRTLGHNVATFDLWFLKRLFRSHDIELKFGSRHYDTNTVGFINWNTFNSDDLFTMVGFDQRDAHNSLEDARQSLESARITRMLFQTVLNP